MLVTVVVPLPRKDKIIIFQVLTRAITDMNIIKLFPTPNLSKTPHLTPKTLQNTTKIIFSPNFLSFTKFKGQLWAIHGPQFSLSFQYRS